MPEGTLLGQGRKDRLCLKKEIKQRWGRQGSQERRRETGLGLKRTGTHHSMDGVWAQRESLNKHNEFHGFFHPLFGLEPSVRASANTMNFHGFFHPLFVGSRQCRLGVM